MQERAISEVAELLGASDSVLFITGAGMSADSGLPTYRGIGGLYEAETTEEGIPIEELLSGPMLQRDPALCWKYIARLESACRGAHFHPGHEVLAKLEQRIDRSWVLTQNVDGFHLDAGSRNVIEIHGNVRRLTCTKCAWQAEVDNYAELQIPPRCPECRAIVRPEVVLFGEMLPLNALAALERELRVGFDLVVVIGTTAVFPYIMAPVVTARRTGIPTVEINPGTSSLSDMVEYHLRLGAKDALERLWAAVQAR